MELDVKNKFIDGKCVVKIMRTHLNTHKSYQLGIVINNDKYLKKLKSHEYTPLLYALDLPMRIAYLYGCFDVEYSSDHEHEILVRDIGSNEWRLWFKILPQLDDDYNGYIIS